MVFRVDETLWLVPVVHGSGSYARALVHWLLEHPADALAVPLPESWGDAVLAGVEALPAVSMVAQVPDEQTEQDWELEEDDEGQSDDGDEADGGSRGRVGTMVPIEPCQAVIAALRYAVSERMAIHWIDPESAIFPWQAIGFPDAYALEHTTLERFASAILPALPSPETDWQRHRIESIAKRIHRLRQRARGRRHTVVALCHLQEWPWIRAALFQLPENLASEPAASGAPASDRDVVGTIGAKRCDAPVVHYGIDARSHLFLHGELPFITALHERARQSLEDDRVWAVEGLKELCLASRSSYRQDLGTRARQITPQLISQCLKYIRNQTLLERRMTPSFYTIVRSAQQMMGDAFAVHLLSSAKDYAYDEPLDLPMVKLGIDRADLPLIGVVSMVSRLPGDPMAWQTMELNRPAKKQDKRKWSSRWNPYQQCSWPEEDTRIESFRQRIVDRARSSLGADLARIEKFTTSMMDGLDLRETLRHWYDGSLYVKIAPPNIGQMDATVMIFDIEPDPRQYAWRSTWFAEHADESTLAFYATPFTKEMLGPGVAVSTYGGAMFLYPPRPIEDIWSDPRLDFADTLEQRLVAAACMHAQSRHVALLSPIGPGVAFKKIAKRFGRRLVHVPLAHFADSVVQQLRLFHVLNGKHVRSYAAHFIRKA
ncbi:MAG: hypothetical protein ACK5OB_04885 [Pirellula sp.]